MPGSRALYRVTQPGMCPDRTCPRPDRSTSRATESTSPCNSGSPAGWPRPELGPIGWAALGRPAPGRPTGANTRNTSQRTSRANHENSNNHWVVPECGESAESGDGEIQVLAAAAELGGVCCCDPTRRDIAHSRFRAARGHSTHLHTCTTTTCRSVDVPGTTRDQPGI